MNLDLAIFLAIDYNFIILRRTCIRFAHEPSTFCILGLGGSRQDICQVARMSRTLLFAQKSK